MNWRSATRSYLSAVVLPICVAVWIYLSFRKYRPIPLEKVVDAWNRLPIKNIDFLHSFQPADWFVYNLPDGLWAFSFTSFVLLSTKNASRRVANGYLVLAIAIMALLEIAQLWLPLGTFDYFDLLAILVGTLAATVLNFRLRTL